MKEIVRQTGYSEERIRKIFTYGDKTMNVNIKTYEECGNSMGQGGHGEGACVADNVIDMLNDENLTEEDRTALTFAVAELIIHEAIHEMDAIKNLTPQYNVHLNAYVPTPTITTGEEGDLGKQNSSSEFGHRPCSVGTAMWGYPDDKTKFTMSDGNNAVLNWNSVSFKLYGMFKSSHPGPDLKKYKAAAERNKGIAEKMVNPENFVSHPENIKMQKK